MSNDKYHHGDLKETLIKSGIKLLNEVGSENFSLRKLAAICDVSHAAPYKHFKSKEDLINQMIEYAIKEFEEVLQETVNDYGENYENITLELGKKYVAFMVNNPDYLKILFLSDFEANISIKNGKIESNFRAFNIFKDCAINTFKMCGIKEEDYSRNIMAMWCMVHGIAVLLANKTVIYDGDYDKLVEDILINNMK
ncbi:MAG: TetR/AcrR family transcriptional regulator [Clostridium butyricum]|nr:TetR/AcrR family transcriptional regulator [Clostridium butyricum]